jgi:tetratricopeptide (TPR) repeat protein
MFDEIASLAGDPERLFQRVAQSLVAAGELHRLFDLRLVEERRRLGLPLDRRTPIDDVEEPLRSQLEAGYLAACREVGELLLEAGRLREAWMYLRPAGDKLSLRKRLAQVAADADEADELIELALYEAVDPERGYAWLLGRNGTCNGITTLDGLSPQLSAGDQTACAAVLIRHVYGELRGNLRGHLHRLTGQPPPDLTVGELVEQHPELTAGGNYHLDASHLASAMRYARLLTDPALVAKALEMADYGARLPSDLQYPGEAPFEELYPTHRLLLAATLGREVDAALEYFGRRAREARDDPQSTTAVETYLILLARAGRAGEALDEYAALVPKDRELSAHAPTLLDLARQSGRWDRYDEICRERNDLLGFAAGAVARLMS